MTDPLANLIPAKPASSLDDLRDAAADAMRRYADGVVDAAAQSGASAGQVNVVRSVFDAILDAFIANSHGAPSATN